MKTGERLYLVSVLIILGCLLAMYFSSTGPFMGRIKSAYWRTARDHWAATGHQRSPHPGVSCLTRILEPMAGSTGDQNLSTFFLQSQATSRQQALAGLWQNILADKSLGSQERLDGIVKLSGELSAYIRLNRSTSAGGEEEAHQAGNFTEHVRPPGVLPPEVAGLLRTIVKRYDAERRTSIYLTDTEERLCRHKVPKNGSESDLPNWKRWQNHITRYRLYSEDDPAVHGLLEDLGSQPITDLEAIPDLGTQIKYILYFGDGSRTMYKPKRKDFGVETEADLYQYDEFERVNGEVASFHLDRILQFYRVPPAVVRMVNLTSEIKRFEEGKRLQDLLGFYISPAGNQCIKGKCDQFCDGAFPVCGRPHNLEGSFAAYLPTRLYYERISWPNPYASSYTLGEPAEWEEDDGYCDSLLESPLYMVGRRLLDIVDMAVFDFFISNRDRHTYHTFEAFDNETNLILYDNGRGFSRWSDDYVGLLAPLYQCCLVRLSTLDILLELATGPRSLSQRMRESLGRQGALHLSLLTEGHYTALDRRVVVVLQKIHECIERNGGRYRDVVKQSDSSEDSSYLNPGSRREAFTNQLKMFKAKQRLARRRAKVNS